MKIVNKWRYNSYCIGKNGTKGDSENGSEKRNGKGTNSFYSVCKLAFVDRLREQERKQDLCYIVCAATAEYTGSTTLLVFGKQ